MVRRSSQNVICGALSTLLSHTVCRPSCRAVIIFSIQCMAAASHSPHNVNIYRLNIMQNCMCVLLFSASSLRTPTCRISELGASGDTATSSCARASDCSPPLALLPLPLRRPFLPFLLRRPSAELSAGRLLPAANESAGSAEVYEPGMCTAGRRCCGQAGSSKWLCQSCMLRKGRTCCGRHRQ